MTNAISDFAPQLGISVHDQIIVGKNGCARLEELKLNPVSNGELRVARERAPSCHFS